MQASNNKLLIASDLEKIADHLSNTTSSQTTAIKEAIAILTRQFTGETTVNILDLGCGIGNSYDEFSLSKSKFNWTGIDIADSPEAQQRIRKDLNYLTYDGVLLPFPDDTIDIVYSRQVFEHVRFPEKLLLEVHRILKPGGFFIGSTSHLEPYHSHSLWNFTPHGFITILKTAGFNSILICPGIDGVTLIMRRLLGYLKIGDLLNLFFNTESPLNRIIEISGKILRLNFKRRNVMKLVFSGHIIFIARKD